MLDFNKRQIIRESEGGGGVQAGPSVVTSPEVGDGNFFSSPPLQTTNRCLLTAVFPGSKATGKCIFVQ
jgi:hypothetical protein